MRMLKPLKLSKHEKILLSGCVLLARVGACASCKDDKDETPAAKITVNEQVLAFDCEESAQDFTFESTLKWTIECGAADWLTVSPLEGKGGTVTVSVAVAANPSATPRSASFFIRSLAEQVEITVNQADDEGAHLLTFAEDFKAYLVENFDTDGDGEISRDEAELITAIECENLGLTSLEGVRNLTNLQTLHCSYNAIETLDVSGMTSLTELLCDHNLITDLNVSDCSSLPQRLGLLVAQQHRVQLQCDRRAESGRLPQHADHDHVQREQARAARSDELRQALPPELRRQPAYGAARRRLHGPHVG